MPKDSLNTDFTLEKCTIEELNGIEATDADKELFLGLLNTSEESDCIHLIAIWRTRQQSALSALRVENERLRAQLAAK